DSTYLRNGITAWIDGWRARGWRTSSGQPVQNADLWRALLAASEGHTLRWHWVRGHRDNRHNNRADQLATLARQQWTSAPSAGSAPRVTPSSSESALPRYEIYARGVSLNGGTGGYGAVIVGPKDTQERSGSWPVASNVAMDLWSVIAGLQALPEPAQVRILTPSKYVVDGATRWLAGWERNGWRTTSGQAVANQSLWEELTRVMGDHALEWQHLPAEAAEEHAERAVSLARDAANRRTSEKPAQ
ncbi:MAG: hypothetical protein GXY79_08860, partial [Chloroflexi bacterium]|nr:hypothetical protein [Chloroflexota bacterium]